MYRCNECKETFPTTDAFYEHVIPLVEAGKHSMGSYTEVPGESYWVKQVSIGLLMSLRKKNKVTGNTNKKLNIAA